MSKDGTRIGSLKQVVELRARISELEARLESILDASEDDMPLAHAEELAALWSAGKLIGGDAHAAAITLRAALAAERERREAAEWVLKEIRIRLHAAGRRPEECWEMSEIDGHLAQFARRED